MTGPGCRRSRACKLWKPSSYSTKSRGRSRARSRGCRDHLWMNTKEGTPKLHFSLVSSRFRAAQPEPQPERGKGRECAGGIEQGIIGRSVAARYECLVNLIQCGIPRSAQKCRNGPRPAPAPSASARAAIQQEAKHKIFREVRALADDLMDRFKLICGE